MTRPQSATEDTLLHRALVASENASRLPIGVVALILCVNAGMVWLVWDGLDTRSGGLVGLIALAGGLINWAALALLPRTGRSFGSPIASALALSMLTALLLVLISIFRPPPWIALVLVGAITAVAIYSTYIEPFRVQITRETLIVPSLPAGVTFTLLHLGDLHVERITRREREINALMRQLQPSVIVFTGDFVNLSYTNDPRAERDIRAVISEWSAPHGVFVTAGTPVVEPFDRVMAFVRDMDNLTFSGNRWHSLAINGAAVHVCGMLTTHDPAVDRRTLAALAQHMPGDGVRILFTHAPDVAPEAAKAGFDLYLNGHTHGGQIRLPLIGAVFSGSIHGKRFIRGRVQVGAMTQYTTRGLGMEGWGAPRARFLCPPEIVLWTIRGE
jgi:uncharacterized protein